LNEKLQIMEAIWEDLRDRAQNVDISASDKALLDERRARAANGKAEVLDWDKVKHTIGQA
jgi:putative addiction module component (TIGR02574 family)